MAGVFISYRREDSAGHAGRLFDKLRARFGAGNVFMDVDTIQPGQDYTRVIDERIGECDVMIILIGRQWLTCQSAGGGRRLDDRGDFVRREILAGLRRGLVMVPVLVEGASMPAEAEFPPELTALARRQAVTLSDVRFESDAADLMEAVERYLVSPITPTVSGGPGARRWGGVGAALFGTGLLAGLLWVNYPGPLQRAPTPATVETTPASATANLTGQWAAEVPIDDKRSYTLRLRLESVDQRLLGSIEFPTGSGSVKDGRVEQGRVSFVTVHRPQFEDADVSTRFEGRLSAPGELELVMQYADVVKRIRLRRQS